MNEMKRVLKGEDERIFFARREGEKRESVVCRE